MVVLDQLLSLFFVEELCSRRTLFSYSNLGQLPGSVAHYFLLLVETQLELDLVLTRRDHGVECWLRQSNARQSDSRQ
jgi:hypothetical protein